MWLWILVGFGSYFLLSVPIALAVGAVLRRLAAARQELEDEAWTTLASAAMEDSPTQREREFEEHVAAALEAISLAKEEVVAALSALDERSGPATLEFEDPRVRRSA